MRLEIALILALSACEAGTTPRATNSATGGGTHPRDDCPETFASAGGACERDDSAEACTYPEGVCSCSMGSYCGGVRPSEETEKELRKTRWRCTPNPPAVRPDGCPGTEPKAKEPCQLPETQYCNYGDCCMRSARCLQGQWEIGQPSCPP
jgi:hypothetical protein